jgi:UDP-N-acetylmuramoyl-L-alanyl-D-glutamate--2,6-diaminopimelate ligase
MNCLLSDLLLDVTTVHVSGDLGRPITGLAYDSRRVQPGGLFVAIRGFHVDGHAYVAQAVAQGAAAIVVDARHWQGSVPATVTLVVVPDSRVALAPLAAAWFGHPGRELTVIGVTGTKGKSTTTDLISQALDGGGRSTGLISTVDFKVGARRWANTTRQSTPEALEVQSLLREMVAAGCTHAVLEATSHALSARWDRLGGCAFNVAVFLNITHEHLDYHGSFAQYRADKARLFSMLEAHNASAPWAIVNADDPNWRVFADAAPASANRLTFALHAPADVRAVDLHATPDGSTFQVHTPWGRAAAQISLPGPFNVANALATLAVALSQGVPLDAAVAALSAVRGPRGRMQPIRCGQPFSVIVDYAHNPDSFEQVFRLLQPLTPGRMIAVFGSAGERDVAKRAIQGVIAGRYCALSVLTDEDPRGEDRAAIIDQIAAGVASAGRREGEGYLCIPDRRAAIAAALQAAQPGDLVLLLGKGHEGSIIYADGSLPWDEAAVARELLAELGYGAAE